MSHWPLSRPSRCTDGSVPPGLGEATGGARSLVRSDRDEHATGTPAGVRRIGEGDVPEGGGLTMKARH